MAPSYGSEEWEAAYQEVLQKRLSKQSPLFIQGSPEWIDAYEKAVQGDAAYKEAAAGWEGTVVLHTVADPGLGIASDSYILRPWQYRTLQRGGIQADRALKGSWRTLVR